MQLLPKCTDCRAVKLGLQKFKSTFGPIMTFLTSVQHQIWDRQTKKCLYTTTHTKVSFDQKIKFSTVFKSSCSSSRVGQSEWVMDVMPENKAKTCKKMPDCRDKVDLFILITCAIMWLKNLAKGKTFYWSLLPSNCQSHFDATATTLLGDMNFPLKLQTLRKWLVVQ